MTFMAFDDNQSFTPPSDNSNRDKIEHEDVKAQDGSAEKAKEEESENCNSHAVFEFIDIDELTHLEYDEDEWYRKPEEIVYITGLRRNNGFASLLGVTDEDVQPRFQVATAEIYRSGTFSTSYYEQEV